MFRRFDPVKEKALARKSATERARLIREARKTYRIQLGTAWVMAAALTIFAFRGFSDELVWFPLIVLLATSLLGAIFDKRRLAELQAIRPGNQADGETRLFKNR